MCTFKKSYADCPKIRPVQSSASYEPKASAKHVVGRGEICHCRHCRRQCKFCTAHHKGTETYGLVQTSVSLSHRHSLVQPPLSKIQKRAPSFSLSLLLHYWHNSLLDEHIFGENCKANYGRLATMKVKHFQKYVFELFSWHTFLLFPPPWGYKQGQAHLEYIFSNCVKLFPDESFLFFKSSICVVQSVLANQKALE